MTADARIGRRSFRQAGGGIVWTARASPKPQNPRRLNYDYNESGSIFSVRAELLDLSDLGLLKMILSNAFLTVFRCLSDTYLILRLSGILIAELIKHLNLRVTELR